MCLRPHARSVAGREAGGISDACPDAAHRGPDNGVRESHSRCTRSGPALQVICQDSPNRSDYSRVTDNPKALLAHCAVKSA